MLTLRAHTILSFTFISSIKSFFNDVLSFNFCDWPQTIKIENNSVDLILTLFIPTPVLENTKTTPMEKCTQLKEIGVCGSIRGHIYHELLIKMFYPLFCHDCKVGTADTCGHSSLPVSLLLTVL